MLLYFRLNICNGGKFITLTVFNCKHMAQKILLYHFCLKSYNIIDFDTFFFYIRSCCLCMFLFIHSLRLSLPWNSPSSSRENSSSCTFRSPSSLSRLSLYWNNTFIENYFRKICTIKASAFKITPQTQTRDHFKGFFETATTIFKPYTRHSGSMYWWVTFLHSCYFHIFSKPTNCPLEIAAYNHGLLIQ